MKTFDAGKLYVIDGHALNQFSTIAERLFSEDRLNADEMRDFAQILEYRLNDAVPYAE